MIRVVFAAALIAVSMIAFTPTAHAARSLDDVLARLEALEKENAGLRKRVQRLEATDRERPVVAAPRAGSPAARSATAPVPAAAALPSAAGQAYAAVFSPVEARNWNGLYIGGSAGMRREEHTWRTNSMLSGFAAGAPNGEDFSSNTGRFGGFVGVNIQAGPKLVVGIEGDVAWGKTKTETQHTIPGASVGMFPLGGGPFGTRDSSQFETTWDASLRVRLGALITPDTLVYMTGGGAWQTIEATASCEPSFGIAFPPVCVLHSHTDTQKKTLPGWTVGAGIETALASHWTGRIEYRYSNFRDFNHIFIQESCCDGNLDTTISLATHMLTFGLAYKFGGL